MATIPYQPYTQRQRNVMDMLENASRQTLKRAPGSPFSYALAETLQAARNSHSSMQQAHGFADRGDCATALYLVGEAERDLARAQGAMMAVTRSKAGKAAFDRAFSCARNEETAQVCMDISNQLSLRSINQSVTGPALEACRLKSVRRSIGTGD